MQEVPRSAGFEGSTDVSGLAKFKLDRTFAEHGSSTECGRSCNCNGEAGHDHDIPRFCLPSFAVASKEQDEQVRHVGSSWASIQLVAGTNLSNVSGFTD